MMKVALAVALVAVLALAWRLNSTTRMFTRQQQTLTEQRQQIQTLTAALADRSKQDTLTLQEKCAARADEVFHQLEQESSSNDPASAPKQSLRSHFNVPLNKCFMTIESGGLVRDRWVEASSVFDAYERREYATYAAVGVLNGVKTLSEMRSEMRPAVCEEHPASGGKVLCHSDQEYKAIVKRYME